MQTSICELEFVNVTDQKIVVDFSQEKYLRLDTLSIENIKNDKEPLNDKDLKQFGFLIPEIEDSSGKDVSEFSLAFECNLSFCGNLRLSSKYNSVLLLKETSFIIFFYTYLYFLNIKKDGTIVSYTCVARRIDDHSLHFTEISYSENMGNNKFKYYCKTKQSTDIYPFDSRTTDYNPCLFSFNKYGEFMISDENYPERRK